MYEWSDIRIFLAVAREGSALGAAKRLGVNQTTVTRRVAALEASLGLRLFERRQDGYRLAEDGQALLEPAARMAAEAAALEQRAALQGRALSGSIRVTSTETLSHAVITRWLAEFIELYPEIRIDLIATDRRLDLAAGEADVAIRAQKAPDDPGIVFRKLTPSPWAAYCSAEYAARRGKPASPAELAPHLLIGVDGELAQLDLFLWWRGLAAGATTRTSCISVSSVQAAIKVGHGIGILPMSLALQDAELMQCFEVPDFGYGVYLVTNAELKDTPRIRAFNEFILARSNAMRHLLEGRRPQGPSSSPLPSAR